MAAMWAGVVLISIGLTGAGTAAGLPPAVVSPAGAKDTGRLAVFPILEELCARLAAFGLVEPMGMQPRFAPRRECKPLLLSFDRHDASEPTSIFTTVRAKQRGRATLSVRFKINVLDPRTQGPATALVRRALRSILRGYDIEMPEDIAVAIGKLADGRYELGPAVLEIRTEREDPRRHNIFVSIQDDETQGMAARQPALASFRKRQRAIDGLS